MKNKNFINALFSKFFNFKSIKLKISVAVILCVAIILTISFSIKSVNSYLSIDTELNKKAENLLAVSTIAASEFLYNFDMNGTKVVGESLFKDNEIASVKITDADSREVFNKSLKESQYTNEADLIHIKKELTKDGAKVGEIYVSLTKYFRIAQIKGVLLHQLFELFIIIVVLWLFINVISNIITSPLVELSSNIQEVSKGDLRTKIEIETKDEAGTLALYFNNMVDNLKTLVMQVAESAKKVNESSMHVNEASEQTAIGAQQNIQSIENLTEGAELQAKKINENLQIVNNINKSIEKISTNADSTLESANVTNDSAIEGKDLAENAITKINKIKEKAEESSVNVNKLGELSSEIGVILDLIKAIANQTNLLSLNAAIEAARAGEHGKGFAVVAEEVKKLAEQSVEATDKITDIIKEIQDKTVSAVNSMNEGTKEIYEGVSSIKKVGDALEKIMEASQSTNQKMQQISSEVNMLSKNSTDFAARIQEISDVTEKSVLRTQEVSSVSEQQSASLQEISSNCGYLSKITKELQDLVSVFKV